MKKETTIFITAGHKLTDSQTMKAKAFVGSDIYIKALRDAGIFFARDSIAYILTNAYVKKIKIELGDNTFVEITRPETLPETETDAFSEINKKLDRIIAGLDYDDPASVY